MKIPLILFVVALILSLVIVMHPYLRGSIGSGLCTIPGLCNDEVNIRVGLEDSFDSEVNKKLRTSRMRTDEGSVVDLCAVPTWDFDTYYGTFKRELWEVPECCGGMCVERRVCLGSHNSMVEGGVFFIMEEGQARMPPMEALFDVLWPVHYLLRSLGYEDYSVITPDNDFWVDAWKLLTPHVYTHEGMQGRCMEKVVRGDTKTIIKPTKAAVDGVVYMVPDPSLRDECFLPLRLEMFKFRELLMERNLHARQPDLHRLTIGINDILAYNRTALQDLKFLKPNIVAMHNELHLGDALSAFDSLDVYITTNHRESLLAAGLLRPHGEMLIWCGETDSDVDMDVVEMLYSESQINYSDFCNVRNRKEIPMEVLADVVQHASRRLHFHYGLP